MRRIVVLVVAVVLLAFAAALVVQSPETGRSAPSQGTPDPRLCASPITQTVASPTTVAAVPSAASSPIGTDPCGGTPAAGTAASIELEIIMGEFDFTPNEITIPENTDVVIVLTNGGSTTHNLRVDGNNNPSDPGIQSGNVESGESVEVRLNLPAGDWYFYCDIMGHYDLGMEGTIHAR